MQINRHQEEINEVYKHLKYLSIAGGVAISFLIFGGYLMISDTGESNQTEQMAVVIPETKMTIVPVHKDNVINELSIAEPTIHHEQGLASEQLMNPFAESEVKNVPAKKEKTSEKSLSDMLVSFTTACENGSVNLSWVTSGKSLDVFEIEQSKDGNTYTTVSKIIKSQKSGEYNHYSHLLACADEKEVYFRLKKQGRNGNFEYSEIKTVACNDNPVAKTNIDVYPVGYGSFKIVINTPAEDHFYVTLTDAENREIATDEFSVVNGMNEFVLKSGSIPRGSYKLRVYNDQMASEKMVYLK